MTLEISSTQLEQLNSAGDCEFVDGMAQYLAGRFRLDARPGFEFGSLSNEVAPIVVQAGKLGLPRYDGYALHVLASFVLGVDYHEMSTVKPVLHSKKLSGDLKVLWLDRWFHSQQDAAMKKTRG